MASLLTFADTAQIRQLIHASRASAERIDLDGERGAHIPPCLWLVKGHGVYLASNGAQSLKQVYAEECDPATNPNWLARTRHIFGQEDRVEVLAIAPLEKIITKGASRLRIRVSPRSLTLTPM